MIIPAHADLAARYRVTNGSRFHLKDIDPADPVGQAAQADRRPDAQAGPQAHGRPAGASLRAGQVGGAADLPGDGCRRQGQHDQARDVRRQSARLRRPRLQGAVERGARSRFPVAREPALPRRGHIGIFNRSYYEETLVVRVHQNILAKQQLPTRPRDQEHLARAFRGHQRLRALPVAPGRAGSKVLPLRVEGRTAQAVSRAPRQAGEALEVLAGGCRRARALRGLHVRLRRHDSPHLHRSGRRGSSCRPIASGSRGWWCRRRSSTRIQSLDPALSRGRSEGARRVQDAARRRSRAEGEAEGPQEVKRCWWPGEDELYIRYHDREWGRPVVDDQPAVRKDLPRRISSPA